MKISGNIVDVFTRSIYKGIIYIEGSRIARIERADVEEDVFILPGLIDAHIHIESSMLTPVSFAQAVVPHGTIGVVADPHEIANVLGVEGVDFMIKSGRKTPLYFWFGAPSCVPATTFETSGATINAKQVEELLQRENILYLSEMMNWPGVVFNDNDVINKIEIARSLNKPVDGHAPGLSGDLLKKYIKAGISTDHECSSVDEAVEKINHGMKIIIREGSAARNLGALKQLFLTSPEMIMLCSDDLHPDTLKERHINKLLSTLIKEGFGVFDVLNAATRNPVEHYNLEAGLLRTGDYADLIVVDNLDSMNVFETWIRGEKVFDGSKALFRVNPDKPVNIFNASLIEENDIRILTSSKRVKVIQIFDGELFTEKTFALLDGNEYLNCDLNNDILKIVVKDRYKNGKPAVGFIKGFGLKKGAFGGSVAHDSHNIICVGVNDREIISCMNKIIENSGGLAVTANGHTDILPLEIAGLMSGKPCGEVAEIYKELSDEVKKLGSGLVSPFMTLSFMALLVIPEIKLSDKGLFDGKEFRFISLFEE